MNAVKNDGDVFQVWGPIWLRGIPPSDLTDRNAKSIVLGGERREARIRWTFPTRGVSGNDRFLFEAFNGDLGAARMIEIPSISAGDNVWQ